MNVLRSWPNGIGCWLNSNRGWLNSIRRGFLRLRLWVLALVSMALVST